MQKSNKALDAFLNLLTLITLGWFSISLGRLVFVIIEKTIGDGDDRFFYNTPSFAISSILIITPIFLIVSGTLHKHYKQGKLNPESAIYRWLTYLMLLIASLVIAGDLIALVNNLLDGDYTLATMLKILTVLVIALGIFLYYWYDMKRTSYNKRSGVAQFAFGAVVVVALASIIGGFIVADSPQIARQKKFDQARVYDLNGLDYAITGYVRDFKEVPTDLSDKRFTQFVDPETKEPYEYRVLPGELEYELCATFILAATESDTDRPLFAGPRYSEGDQDWQFHEAGRQCYKRKITEEEFDKDVRAVPVPAEPADLDKEAPAI